MWPILQSSFSKFKGDREILTKNKWKLTRRLPVKSLTFDDVFHIVSFIRNYEEDLLPGRIPKLQTAIDIELEQWTELPMDSTAYIY